VAWYWDVQGGYAVALFVCAFMLIGLLANTEFYLWKFKSWREDRELERAVREAEWREKNRRLREENARQFERELMERRR
jgi:hypothetical protein